MAEYTATDDFATTITVAGSNKPIVLSKGDTVELDDDEFGAVERDVPGGLKPATKAVAAKAPAKGSKSKGDG